MQARSHPHGYRRNNFLTFNQKQLWFYTPKYPCQRHEFQQNVRNLFFLYTFGISFA